jgi:hypothetical protein
MNRKHLTLLALLGTGCLVSDGTNSVIVVTKVIVATPATSTTASSACVYDPATAELTFGTFDPAAGYVHGIVLENRLQDNAKLGPGRINTNDFQVEYATINYEVVSGPAQNLPEQTVPGNSLIATGGKGITQLRLVPPAFVTSGTSLRIHIQVHGRLLDGKGIKSSAYEYVAFAQTGFKMATPACTAPAVAVFCENGGAQDTSAACK